MEVCVTKNRQGSPAGLRKVCRWCLGCLVGFQEALEMSNACRVTQLPEALGFDLANAFAGHFELLADFFQRAGITVDQAEAKLKNLPFALGQTAKDILQL